MFRQPFVDLGAAGHGDDREGDVVQRAGVHESLADPVVELLVVPPHRHPSGDDRPHGGPADEIYRDLGFVQGADHPDVGICPGAAARQDQADRLADDHPRQALQVAFVALAQVEQPIGRGGRQPGVGSLRRGQVGRLQQEQVDELLFQHRRRGIGGGRNRRRLVALPDAE